MTDSVKFFKIKLIKKIIACTKQVRENLFSELLDNATDPIIVKRRLRMIRHINLYENQLIKKIEQFETNDVNDLIDFDPWVSIKDIVNRSA